MTLPYQTQAKDGRIEQTSWNKAKERLVYQGEPLPAYTASIIFGMLWQWSIDWIRFQGLSKTALCGEYTYLF